VVSVRLAPARAAPVVTRAAGLLAAIVTAWLPGGQASAAPPTPVDKTDQRCRFGAVLQTFQPVLPIAKQVLRDTGALTIVALGSSTTAGSGASADDRSYPAVLAAELERRLPDAKINVINKGVGGQSAYDMLLRMDADVIDEKPSIVIWQTVVNDAIRNVGEEKIAKILRKGITKVQAAGIDMIMMDLQWLPREGRYPKYDDYRAILAKTAQEHGVSIFPRHAMMKNWAGTKRFTAEELVGMDGLQMVDAGYRCLAIRLADGIAAALAGGKPGPSGPPKPTN
jgi:lysophospholipase L1-like esterase